MYFNQEEISLSARFYTHGFDIYSLKDVLLYYYHDKDDQPARQYSQHPNWMRLQERGRKRLNHLLGHTVSENPSIVQEMDKYGLGTQRTLGEYQAFCGIDFKKRLVSERALRAGFIEDLNRFLDKPVHVPEVDDTASAAAFAVIMP